MKKSDKIVTTIRADVMNNMISIESPMGKCLLKHRVGDTVTIELENGVKYDVVIREIRKVMMNRRRSADSKMKRINIRTGILAVKQRVCPALICFRIEHNDRFFQRFYKFLLTDRN